MVALSHDAALTGARAPEKSYDVALLVSVGFIAVALMVVLASVVTGGLEPADISQMAPPYP
jgi:hypothetical protein